MGVTAEEFKKIPGTENLSCFTNAADQIQTCAGQSSITYAGQIVNLLSVNFIKERSAQVSIATLGGSGEIIRSALNTRYGQPTRKRTVPQRMKNGAAYKMTVTEWRTKDGGLISMEDHPSPQNEVFTSLMSAAWLKWQAGANKASAKEKADL